MSRSPEVTNPIHVAALTAARGNLIDVRDTLPAWHALSLKMNEMIAEIERLLGY